MAWQGGVLTRRSGGPHWRRALGYSIGSCRNGWRRRRRQQRHARARCHYIGSMTESGDKQNINSWMNVAAGFSCLNTSRRHWTVLTYLRRKDKPKEARIERGAKVNFTTEKDTINSIYQRSEFGDVSYRIIGSNGIRLPVAGKYLLYRIMHAGHVTCRSISSTVAAALTRREEWWQKKNVTLCFLTVFQNIIRNL